MIIDFHAHILPGADHGSRSLETTKRQLALIAAGGTDAVVATPHFYPHRDNIEAFLARRTAALEKLCTCEIPPSLQVFLGAEVQVCEGLDEMEELEALCVQGTNVILLEMPFTKWGQRLINTVVSIAERGLVPVLAHIDRYPRNKILELLKRGVLAQLNAEAFQRFFDRRRAMGYLRSGSVVALGSDLHGAETDGYDDFHRMRERLGSDADAVFFKTAELLKNAENCTRLRAKCEI
ncbi:MAG: hypothetical protein IJY22_07825 [Clostridia bacterium]|nr:hypothetical protein [Clostridia bacterium]